MRRHRCFEGERRDAIEGRERQILQEKGTRKMDRPETELEVKLGLALSVAEKRLIDTIGLLNHDVVTAIRQASKGAVRLSVHQLDDLADALSAEANRTDGRILQRRLDALVRKIDQLTASHLHTLLDAAAPGASTAGSLEFAGSKSTLGVRLTPIQREVLGSIGLRKDIRRRLQGDGVQTIQFTHREFEYLHEQARMGTASASSLQKKRLLTICDKIDKILGAAARA